MKKHLDAKKVFELWHSDLRNDEVAVALGVSRNYLAKVRSRYGLPKRPDERGVHEEDNPTPEQIAERAAEIRSRWSESEHRLRQVGATRARWQPPRYVYDGRNSVFSH